MRYIQFLLLFLMFVGSFVVMAYAFSAEGWESLVFIAGLLLLTLSVLASVEIGRRGLRHR